MKHLKHMLETCLYRHNNICNIEIYFCNMQMKHFQHTYETPKTLESCAWNMHVMWHPNIFLQHPDKTLKNIRLKQQKHLKHMLATCLYCHCNICNILEILLQHLHKTLKHKSKKHVTLETQRHRWPQPTWWGTPVTSKLGLGGHQEQRPNVNSGADVGLWSPSCRRASWMGVAGAGLSRPS
jgi:hypothetical protein